MTKSTAKGYKAMNKNMTCLNHSFKVGKTYTIEGELSMCSSGFHFCENLYDVYEFYPKESDTIICEIEALGEVLKEGSKSCTNKIKIVRRLEEKEILDFVLKKANSGSRNSGDGNSGSRNSGDGNSGDGNSGDGNSGDGNSGSRNSGYGNSGDGNSGNGNSGSRNSGDWNSGDGNSGYFNTKIPVYFFNKPSDLVYTKEFEDKIRSLNVKPIVQWISESSMTDKEKTDFPFHKTTGGFLRKTERYDWSGLTDKDKILIKSLPNFDDSIFSQISGISLSDDIEVIIAGVTKKITKQDAKKLGLI